MLLFGVRSLGVLGKQPSPCSPSVHLGKGGGKASQSIVVPQPMKGWDDLVDRIDRRVPVEVFLVIADRSVENDDLRGTRGVAGSSIWGAEALG